jgi:hypothetical protein
MTAPWFKLYSKEILSDPKIKLLDHDHLGKLLLLWAFANEDGCCIPSDPESIGKLIGVSGKNQMVKHMVWVSRFFVPVEGDPSRLLSPRLFKERQAYEAKCDQLRVNGAKGGRPRKPNGLPNGLPDAKPDGNQNVTEVGSEKKEKACTPQPPKGAEGPPLLEIPCAGKGAKAWGLQQQDLDGWATAYPGLEVLAEVRKAKAWLEANPTRGKTHGGMARFLVNWLSRAQDSGRASPGRVAPLQPRQAGIAADAVTQAQVARLHVPKLASLAGVQ